MAKPLPLLPACALLLTAAVTAQTNRTMQLNSPAYLNSTVQFQVNHPPAIAGNIYAVLWSPPFAGTVPVSVPGFTVAGDARVNPLNFVTPFIGVFGGSGTAVHSIGVPNSQAFLGYQFDLQSLDLDATNSVLSFADNDLELTITAGICGVVISRATSNSATTGDNDLRRVDNSNIGAPVSQGLATFAFLPIRHRGDEGFVEGYAGTFSATAFNSDIDSVSYRRVARHLNGVQQVVACPNGYDVAIIRDRTNGRQYSLLSYERATGTARIIPGSTWVDGGTGTPAQQFFYPGFSRDGQWAAIYVKDSLATPTFAPMVWAFRTDGLSAVIDITPAGTTTASAFFDGTLAFTNDFLLASGSAGFFWTSATAPAQLQPLAVPGTTATGGPNIWAFPFSWRVSPDGSTAYFPLSSIAANSRAEMDMAQLTNNAGTPQVVNYTQFTLPTGMTEFGYSGITPSTANNSSNGIKASVSPDGSQIAFLGMIAGTTTSFTGVYVADGTANPTLRIVPGALFYSEVAFINNTTVLFFAGPTNTTQSFYSLDVPSGTISQIGAAADHRTRGQFWSLNKNWWYFIRSDGTATASRNDIVAVNCATGAVHSVTGSEFGAGGSVSSLQTGSFNTTADPWFALEMQLRRAPVGDFAYFTARKSLGSASFEDANVFGFDIENGGTAVQLSANAATGTSTVVRNIENLTIAADGNHVAWTERAGTAATVSEDVFHLNLGTSTIVQASVSAAGGQTITDGQLRFTCNPPSGLVWSIGTGSTAVPTSNARVEWAALGTSTPVLLTSAPAGTQLYYVIGTHN